MEEKKKNSVGFIILAIILLLACIGMGAFIFINKDKLITKENSSANEQKKNKNQKDEEESVTFSDSELEKYVNYISPISIGPSAAIYDTDTVISKNLSAAKKIEYIGSKVYSKHTSTSDSQHQYDIISENDVKNAVEEVYGPNTYEKVTFNLGCGDYIFNESEKNYYSITGCGGVTDKLSQNVVIDYKATKNKLEITTAYAFTDSNFKIYKDYNYTVVLDEYKVDSSEMMNYLTKYIKEHKDELNHIVYTFESTDGSNYYFTGFKNNK